MNESPIRLIEHQIIQELHKGEKNIGDLVKTLIDDRPLICLGLNELTNRGFIDEKYVILKEAKDNKSGRAGKRYWLSETGKNFYNLNQHMYEYYNTSQDVYKQIKAHLGNRV